MHKIIFSNPCIKSIAILSINIFRFVGNIFYFELSKSFLLTKPTVYKIIYFTIIQITEFLLLEDMSK